MIDFVIANLDAVIALLSAIVLMGYALITRQWALLKTAAYSLMLSAERLMTTKEGIEKMDAVLEELWNRVPIWIKKAYSKERLRKDLQRWYDAARSAIQ